MTIPPLQWLKNLSKPWLLVLLTVPLYLSWTFNHSLWNPDETRDAGIAAEMYRSGDHAVPKLNGEAFLEKPPLYYWTCNLVYRLSGGVSAGATRLPAALYGLLGIFFTFLIGRMLWNEEVGFWAALIVATTVQYFRMSHFSTMDICLAALVTGAIYFHLKRSYWGFAFLTTLAFFSKGFLGVILPGIVVTFHLLTEKRFKDLGKSIGVGALVWSALALPWFWNLWQEGGVQYLKVFFIDNHWTRFFSEAADHAEHFWFFYFLSFPADFLPWTPFLIPVVISAFKRPQEYLSDNSKRFVTFWFLLLLAFFCVSSSKRSIYLLPLFPAVALLAAAWMQNDGPAWVKRVAAWLFGAMTALVVIAGVTLVHKLERDKTFLPVIEELQRRRNERVLVGYQMSEMERGVFGFYLQGPFENIKAAWAIESFFAKNKGVPFVMVANRNKQSEIESHFRGRAQLVYAYRADKKTRSYLIYENTDR